MEQFVKITPEWMALKYDEFNKKLFGGKLPKCRFIVDNATSRWGLAVCKWAVDEYGEVYSYGHSIKMTNAWSFPEAVKENTLVHEMIHIEDYYLNPNSFCYYDNGWIFARYNAHGNKFFQPEAKRLREFGFDIDKYIPKEDVAVSIMNDEARARIEARRERMQGMRYTLLAIMPEKGNMIRVYKLKNVSTAKAMADEAKKSMTFSGVKWIEVYTVTSNVCKDWNFSEMLNHSHLMSENQWLTLISKIGNGARLIERRNFDVEKDAEFFKNLDKQLAEGAIPQAQEIALQGDDAVVTTNADGSVTTELA